MEVNVKFIEALLLPHGLKVPRLSILEQDSELAHILLFQPKGKIVVRTAPMRIGNDPNSGTNLKYRKFFESALEKQVHLAATPEYSCPVDVVIDLINTNIFPSNEKIWMIGTESMTKDELKVFSSYSVKSHPNLDIISQ